MDALHRVSRSTTTPAPLAALWRGTVVEVYSTGYVAVTVPLLAGPDAVGPIPSTVAGLTVGDNVIVVPLGGVADDLVVLQLLADEPSVFPPSDHTHTALEISDSTVSGRGVLTAPNPTAARTAIGAGTSSLDLGITDDTAKVGSYQPTWAQVTGKPAAFTPTAHSHTIADTADLQAALDAKQASGSYATTTQLNAKADKTALSGKSDTGHLHGLTDITGLSSALADKQASGDYATSAALTSGLAGKAESGHTHTIANTAGLQSALDTAVRGTDGKKYRTIACTVRNTGSGFALINDAGHTPVGVTSVTTQADTFVLNYSFTAATVSSLVITGDEKMTKDGYIFGASVGFETATVSASQPGGAADYIYWNAATSAWKSFNGFVTGVSMNSNTGLVTCTHGSVVPAVGGTITSRSLSRHGVLDGMGSDFTAFYFVDASGTPDKTPNATHRMWLHRAGARAVPMSELVAPNSNVWIYGVMEVA